ncbi:putative Outer membrane efflux protein [uncultured Pleomorphomonas sp.]|uniref:Putative Outer membrane efflux protein n=1 Tax=uncultured Pleomorphomonas sp. TaxID=442121 RepID=A0A212LEB1_9HYPH|nr:TolC family protein [uncultured Pleomorphomonas sp.]SCM75912.1 putative Outer membrane efflux protein [uncultured Pleomorphomonas sp.]
MFSPALPRAAGTWLAVPIAGLLAFGAQAAEPKSELADLLAIARRMNPEVAATALDADAARARVDYAGAWDDPKVKIELTSPRHDFGSLSEETYQIRQMLPLWGQTALKREIAEWEASKATASVRDVEIQIAYRVKVAYAEYHSAHLALDETQKLTVLFDRLAGIARARYAENAAPLADVTGVQSEAGALRADIARLAAEKKAAAARLNRLLGRNADTPLAARPSPRAVPPLRAINTEELVGRANAGSPRVRMGLAEVGAANSEQRLAERNFLPGVELGASAMRENDRFEGVEVMVEFSVPLQWNAKRAEQREAAAKAAAARVRLDALRLDNDADIRAAFSDLTALGTRRKVIAGTTLPQARIALDASTKAYALGKADFPTVLAAEQALRRALVDSIEATFKEQLALAEIERIVGEDF